VVGHRADVGERLAAWGSGVWLRVAHEGQLLAHGLLGAALESDDQL